MRMTRAALRAREHAEEQENEQPEVNDHVGQEQQANTPKRLLSTNIHEDIVVFGSGRRPETDISADTITNTIDASPVRLALRDITDGNYPKADNIVKLQTQTPVKSHLGQQSQEEQGNLQTTTKKVTGSAKPWTKKKSQAPIVVEIETEQEKEEVHEQEPEQEQEQEQEQEASYLELSQVDFAETGQEAQQLDDSTYQESETRFEEDHTPADEETSGPGPAIQEDEEQLEQVEQVEHSTTPKFDPAIHISKDEERTTEDSFVHSITSRSPAKFVQSQAEHTQSTESVGSSISFQAHTPRRRTSSTNFEQSFEAMDSLEDTIEQLTADLPVLPAEEIHLPNLPSKPQTPSLRQGHVTTTPNSKAVRTPRTATSKFQSVLKAQDKENTPPSTRTPVSKPSVQKPTVEAKTPVTKAPSPLQLSTSTETQSSPNKVAAASARKKVTTKGNTDRVEVTSKKPAISVQPKKMNRKSVILTNSGPDTATRKLADTTLYRKSLHKQPLATTTNTRSEMPPKKQASSLLQEKKGHVPGTSLSFSNSPAKLLSAHQRRITSGGVLSTSKPGFIPSKSTKPPTTATFALPGEAVAEKLKAQREAREEKMRQPKMTLAEQKAAKLKADREAREERVKLNQIKAEKAKEEKEIPKISTRPGNNAMLTISKARAEAAERGRQASKDWAEKMLKKKQQQAGAPMAQNVGAEETVAAS